MCYATLDAKLFEDDAMLLPGYIKTYRFIFFLNRAKERLKHYSSIAQFKKNSPRKILKMPKRIEKTCSIELPLCAWDFK